MDLTVLLIDDEPLSRMLFSVYLQEYPIKILCFAEPVTVLKNPEIIESAHLIITDYAMPYMSGLDFFIELRKRNVWTPVVVCTAASGEILDNIRIHAVECKVDVINRPISKTELINLLKKYLTI